MANTTTKTTSKAKTTKTTNTEVKTEPKVVVTKLTAPAKKFNRDEEIMCTSVTVGGLTLVGSKSKDEYRWEDYGDTAYVRFDDLQALYTTKSPFLTKPLFIIEDEDLVNQWGSLLAPIYSKIHEDDVDLIFTLSPQAFKSKILGMPEGLKDSVKTRASQKIQDGSLYDIRIIKIIDETLNTAFVDLVI